MSGITGLQTELLYSLAVPVTKNTYTTQALIGPVATTATVPHIAAGYFSDSPNPLGRSLYLQAFGTIGNVSAATFAPEMGLDTTPGTLANGIPIYSTTATTSGVTAPFNVQAWITCQAYGDSPATTGGMTLQVNGTWSQAAAVSGGAASAGSLSSQFASTITGLFPNVTYFLEFFGTWGTSSVSNTTTIQQMTLWGLN
jgi:hypothetical protein